MCKVDLVYIQVAQHLRWAFSSPQWLRAHAHMKINEMVVMYIDKEEFEWPAGDPPEFSTRKGISNEYCFMMRGVGGGPGEMRVAGRRFSCWCPPCSLAFDTGEGMDARLQINECNRSHLSSFSEGSIECRAASGVANARVSIIIFSCTCVLAHESLQDCSQSFNYIFSQARQKELWKKLKPLLQAGKHAAVQARELWSDQELVHMRPGHFWAFELGDADGKGSPILHEYTKKNEYFTLSNGERHRGDEGDCLLLVRFYFERVADDAKGLTFVKGKAATEMEFDVINSSELRAVQGRQQCDIKLIPICMFCYQGYHQRCSRCNGQGVLPLRERGSRLPRSVARVSHVQIHYDANQRFFLDSEVDEEIRKLCVGT